MSAYASFSRKLNRGRPARFKNPDMGYLQTRKQDLFEKNSNNETMSLTNLAYHFGKLTKEEYDTACFLEFLYHKLSKSLGVKTLPTASPHMWSAKIQQCYYPVQQSNNEDKAKETWQKIRKHLEINNPNIAHEFLILIGQHHSYEELHAVKVGSCCVLNILKEGLSSVTLFLTERKHDEEL